MNQTRREFIRNSAISTASLPWLSLSRLTFADRAEKDHSPLAVDYQGWQDVYRNKWTWDSVHSGTHFCNCTHNCAWRVYVREGIVWREEQAASYKHLNEGLSDDNPQGCQKGGALSHHMYSENRILHPLKRVGSRGSRRWQRVSWDDALTDIAKQMIEVVRDAGSDRIIIPAATQGREGKARFANTIGGVTLDSFGDIGDSQNGASMTTGTQMHAGSSDSRLLADCIILWIYNANCTRIADAHHLYEARYNGARLVNVSCDQNPTHVHADYWMNPKPGTDTALALAMAHIILRDNLYDTAFMKEQTDMPFLLRKDNDRFLRASDMLPDGSQEVFYVWDNHSNQALQAPGSMGSTHKTLLLGDVDPALEGQWQVILASGQPVQVTPVFEYIKENVKKISPEFAQQVTGVGAATIEKVASVYATADTALIQCGWGMPKMYHGDSLQRAIFMIAALTGNIGKVGGGVWVGSILEGGGGRSFPKEYLNGRHRVVPGGGWLYVHGGLREVESRWVPVPKGSKTAQDYMMEGFEKGWMPVYPKPGEDPRILIECGSNLLRRTRMNHILKEKLWPKLKLVLTIDFHMSSSALMSDYVLPAAGYYESAGIKYSDGHSPYHVLGEQAVEPVGDSKHEWWIFAEICKRIQALAPGMGITEYEDVDMGITRNLAKIYDVFTEQGKYPEDIPAIDLVKEDVEQEGGLYKGIDFETFRRKGQANWTWEGTKHSPGVAPSYTFTPGKLHADCSDYTEGKQPWRTLTGRAQFYLDHDWFIEFGEALPSWVPPPMMGGDHPFRITSGHARWSIHSWQRDGELMLRLQRGESIIYMNDEDAKERSIEDHEVIEVFNDVGDFQAHVMTTPMMQRFQIHSYHAWETYMFRNGKSHAGVYASQVKPLGMVGNYGHLRYSPGFYQPTNVDKGSTCDIRKVTD